MRKFFRKALAFLSFQVFFSALIAPFLLFWGPFEAVKAFAVGSVYTSRHPQYVKLFLSQEEIDKILAQGTEASEAGASDTGDVERKNVVNSGGIVIEDIRGKSFKGKVMLIKDSTRVKVAVTSALGESGERVSELAKNAGAVAAVNAGGFNDPNGKGNGGFPMGITMHDGQVLSDDSRGGTQDIIALDEKGKLIIGKMNLAEMKQRGIKEAINFFPQLVKEGKGIVKGDGGWGIGPRTGIGQRPDGTIIFVVIDGRQFQSYGATIRDLQNIFLEYGAVTAANLDGGSSTTMFYDGQVINKPADIFGERYVPTAFVVKP